MKRRLRPFAAALFNRRRVALFFTWCCTALVLTLMNAESARASIMQVEVSSAQFSTFVSATYISNGWFTTVSRPTISTSPTSDDLNVLGPAPYDGGGESRASSSLISVEAYSAVFNGHGSAVATNQISFSPLADQTQTLSLLFSSDWRYYYCSGSVDLFDVTANADLWNYNWSGFQGTVPWVPTGGIGSATAELDPETAFLSSHTYRLTMITGAGSASDTDEAMIQLQGLEAVPEPHHGSLLVIGLGGLLAFRKKLANDADKMEFRSQKPETW